MSKILEQSADEFKKFVATLKGMIGESNALNISDGRIVLSIIDGMIIQDFEQYPDLKMHITKVKEAINVLNTLIKLPVEYVIWEEEDIFYSLKIYINGSDIPIVQHIQKRDNDILSLDIPDLDVYQQQYNKELDKNTYSSISSAIKEFNDNGKTEVWLELDNDNQLIAIKCPDPSSTALLTFPFTTDKSTKKLKLSNLYNGRNTSGLVINIQQDKRNKDRFLIVTYPSSNPSRKCLRYAEVFDESIQFF